MTIKRFHKIYPNVDEGVSKIKKINFYRVKYEALASFVGWVVKGNPYNIAVEQSSYYNAPFEKFEGVVRDLTMTRIFMQNKWPISESLRRRLMLSLNTAKTIDLTEYSLSPDEVELFNRDLRAVEKMLMERDSGSQTM